MKTIGLLGGMSWESTVGYYKEINQGVNKELGGLHSAKIILDSVDFGPIEKLQHKDDWDGTAEILIQAAQGVERAGADFLLICTNTMHKVAQQIQQSINIPLLHIADATAEALTKDGVKKVGLLGTAFTMEQEFYKSRLINDFGLDVIVPEKNDRAIVHSVIYKELCLGQVQDASRVEYLRIIQQLSDQGAEAVILGCTEIAMLVKPQDTDVKLYDTTSIHAAKAVQMAIYSS